MFNFQRTQALISMLALAPGVVALAGPDKPLFAQTSKDKLVYREVLPNGDFCQVRQYVGDEHIGLRIAYLITEQTIDEPTLRSLVQTLIRKHCGKREGPLLLEALNKFRPSSSSNSDHWLILVKDPSYSECFIKIDWVGESITVQIKYYK